MAVAFVLSGGGSLGAIQVGMARALFDRGIRPDLWVGTSVGALNAAFLAARPPERRAVDELARLWRRVRRSEVLPLRPLAGFVGFFGGRDHLVPDGGLRRLLSRELHLARLEDARTPVHIVATALHSGRDVLLSRGPAVEAVMASLAVPGVLPPVRWGDALLMDGGVSNNAPISHAIKLGATDVYVLPAGAACESSATPTSAIGMVLHALTLMLMRHLLNEIESSRARVHLIVLPPPCPQKVQATDFRHAKELIDAGERAARLHLDALDAGLVDSAPLFGLHHPLAGEVRVATPMP